MISNDMKSGKRIPMYGSIVQWMYEELAGIQAAGPGFKTINIRPLILNGAGISSAAATYSSVRGRISSAWTVNDSGITLDVTIPANITATIHVPGTDPSRVTESGVPATRAPGVTYVGATLDAVKYAVGSGTYHFRTRTYKYLYSGGREENGGGGRKSGKDWGRAAHCGAKLAFSAADKPAVRCLPRRQ
jgi:hypothetical protein